MGPVNEHEKTRNEAWEGKWLPRFKALFQEKMIYHHHEGVYQIIDGDNSFYFNPVNNTVHDYKDNVDYVKHGLKFLIKRFFPEY
jgi:hypothetical protein